MPFLGDSNNRLHMYMVCVKACYTFRKLKRKCQAYYGIYFKITVKISYFFTCNTNKIKILFINFSTQFFNI